MYKGHMFRIFLKEKLDEKSTGSKKSRNKLKFPLSAFIQRSDETWSIKNTPCSCVFKGTVLRDVRLLFFAQNTPAGKLIFCTG